MKLTFCALLSLGCSVVGAAPIYAPGAGLGASASLTRLRVEVIDLRPDDGIAPMAQISGVAFVRARSGVGCVPCLDASGVAFSSELLVPDTSSPYPYPIFPATSRITGTSMETLTSGQAQNNRPDNFGGVARISGDPANHRPLFTLSPYTAVRITGQYAVDAWVVAQEEGQLITSAFIQTRGADPGSTSVRVDAENTYWSPDSLHNGAAGDFSATWSNSMGRTRNVWGAINMEVGGVVTSVPEPETYALMAAGLGMVGVGVRRRRNGRR